MNDTSKTHVLENDLLKVTVADAGAELISVIDKESGKERIWVADPSVWNRHAPILFPFIGNVVDKKYRIGGKEYSMKTQHGFARDMEFTCIEEDSEKITHFLKASDITKEIYPYDFRLTVQHSICANQPRELKISWVIENAGTDRMYYSIGGHPGFLMPDGIKKEDCYLTFPGREKLNYFPVDSPGFAHPEKMHCLELENGSAHYQDDIPDTWIFDGQKIETVEITLPDGRPFVSMDCSQFPMLGIWANPAGTFICLEPWFGRTDNAGFTGTLEEKKGIESLQSGEKKEISYTILFH